MTRDFKKAGIGGGGGDVSVWGCVVGLGDSAYSSSFWLPGFLADVVLVTHPCAGDLE